MCAIEERSSAKLILILIHLSSRVILMSFVMFRDLIRRNQYVTYPIDVYIDLFSWCKLVLFYSVTLSVEYCTLF